jgi:oxygen-independent coproporphyrinogen III oxidase
MTRPDALLRESPYQGYAYAYPHKTAYRRLPEPVSLRDVWARERREALFLYIHIPFCEMRCGFCNLFTESRPRLESVTRYLATLRREADQVREALGAARFARLAVGGGTPTFLDEDGVEALFRTAEQMGAELKSIPISVETSPGTAEGDKLALLRERGVTRISVGIQSFVDAEVAAAARPQDRADVDRALAHLRAARFPVLNIDLIYGLPGQTVPTWLASIRAALEYAPEELYLYPLYVRPLTGLGRSGRAWDDQRLACYRAGRDLLLSHGYEQVSMRMFRAPALGEEAGPVYCCQDDGMVGLGCGARSYTRGLHYSREYAVGALGVRAIIADYLARTDEALATADYGFRLGPEDQRRRYILQSLLQQAGLDLDVYRSRFGDDPCADFPELNELERYGLARHTQDRLRLTEQGMERSDAIGPWLYSRRVTELMRTYEWH